MSRYSISLSPAPRPAALHHYSAPHSPHRLRGRRQRRLGFTLVEMLMVIVIIALLAGFLLVAVRAAMIRAKRAAVTTEINNLDHALQQYRDQANSYPPDCATFGTNTTDRNNRIMTHVRRAFPRCTISDYATLRTTLGGAMPAADGYSPVPDLDTLDQAEAMVFFLGGMPSPVQSSGTTDEVVGLVGFSANALNPFSTTTGSRTPSLFEFDPTRLKDLDNDGWPEYYPKGISDGDTRPPYVYFDGVTLTSDTWRTYPAKASGSLPALGNISFINTWGVATPYRTMTPNVWANANKFQIIAAGLDAKYGDPAPSEMKQYDTGLYVPSNTALPEADLDNLTNFTTGTIGDAQR